MEQPIFDNIDYIFEKMLSAIRKNNLEKLELLHDTYNLNEYLNLKTWWSNYTPLQFAISYENLEVVNWFSRNCNLCSSVNISDSLGRTPLHNAVIKNNLEMVKLLIL